MAYRLSVLHNRAMSTFVSKKVSFRDENVVQYIEGQRYRRVKKPQVQTFDDLSKPVWDEFTEVLHNHAGDVDIYYLNSIKPAFNVFLLDFFLEIVESSQGLTRHQIDVLYSESGKTEEKITKATERYDVTEARVFRNAINDYFKNLRENLLQFTERVYTGIVNADLLSREESINFPSVSDSQKKLF